MGTAAEEDLAPAVVDRAVGQVLDLAGGGAVEECEQADECLVGVDSRVGGPAVEQLSLPIAGQRWAADPRGWGAVRPWVGSIRTSRLRMAKRKNCRNPAR